jgi:chromosomal replication initiation ATPase DnaA
MITTQQLTEKVDLMGMRRGVIHQTEKQRCNRALEDVSLITGYSKEDLLGRNRKGDLAMARFCVYLCVVRMGMSYKGAARFLQRNHGTIMHGVKELEKIKSIVHWGEYERTAMTRMQQLAEMGYRI